MRLRWLRMWWPLKVISSPTDKDGAPVLGSHHRDDHVWRLILMSALLIVTALSLIIIFHWLGFGLVLACAVVAIVIARTSTFSAEQEQVRQSIELSAADITAVLDQWEAFQHGTSVEAVADRSVHFALLDDSHQENPIISRFHKARVSSELFIDDLEGVVTHARTIHMLEHILSATDEMARELQEAWVGARQYASQVDSPVVRSPESQTRTSPSTYGWTPGASSYRSSFPRNAGA
ncbi:hypothetical protein [Corynebacterium sp. SFY-M4]|uniref:hypothetical protein n=1 Tax=Corynebacterium sp. SFY-M4 TaxID=3092265 RepID=UPI00298D87B1|nr:hypothetical protein [Corynebacterium sp. SFY-M4]